MKYLSPKSAHGKTCTCCDKKFLGRSNQIYCSFTCASKHRKIKNPRVGVFPHLTTGTIGAIAELSACIDLMKMGYEVFRAVSQSSDCDLLATKNGVVCKLEVRTGNYTENKKIFYPTQNTAGKKVVVVTHSDNKTHYVGWHP